MKIREQDGDQKTGWMLENRMEIKQDVDWKTGWR